MYYRYIVTMFVFVLLMIFQLAPAFERGGGGGGDRRDERQQQNYQGGGSSSQDTYVPPDARGNSFRGEGAAAGGVAGYRRGETNEENQQNQQNQQQYYNPYPYGMPPEQQPNQQQPYQQPQQNGGWQQSGQPN